VGVGHRGCLAVPVIVGQCQRVQGGSVGPIAFGEPRAGGRVRQAVAGPADGEALVVQELAYAADQQHLMVLVVAPVAAPLHGLELREFLLPVAQHIRLDRAQPTHLADGEVAFGGDGGEQFLH